MKNNILHETVKRVTRQVLKEWGDAPLTDERREELRLAREKDQQEFETRNSALELLVDSIRDEKEFANVYYKIVYDRLKDHYERRFIERNSKVLKQFINVWNGSPLGERFKLYNRDYELVMPDIIVIDSYVKGSPDNLPYEQRIMTNVPLKDCARIKTKNPSEINVIATLLDFYGMQVRAKMNFEAYLREKSKKDW